MVEIFRGRMAILWDKYRGFLIRFLRIMIIFTVSYLVSEIGPVTVGPEATIAAGALIEAIYRQKYPNDPFPKRST